MVRDEWRVYVMEGRRRRSFKSLLSKAEFPWSHEMERWKDGRTEGWKDGRLEGWRSGDEAQTSRGLEFRRPKGR
jgi:hypothetical protein